MKINYELLLLEWNGIAGYTRHIKRLLQNFRNKKLITIILKTGGS